MTGSRESGNEKIVVFTRLIGGSVDDIKWKLVRDGDGFRVLDVNIGGLWLVDAVAGHAVGPAQAGPRRRHRGSRRLTQSRAAAILSKTIPCPRSNLAAMDLITQEQSLCNKPLAGGETVRLWRDARYDALECISATFHTHEYALHTHETYVVGIIEAGCETYFCRGEHHWAGPGDFCMVNPEEVHDGAPHEGGYRYRMIYPTVGFMSEIAEDVFDRPCLEPPMFRSSRVHDPELAVEFQRAHMVLEASGDVLERDQHMILLLGKLLARHAGAPSFRSDEGERSAIGSRVTSSTKTTQAKSASMFSRP